MNDILPTLYKQILTIPIDAEPGDLPHLQSAAGTPFGTEENIENLEQLWIWSAGMMGVRMYVYVLGAPIGCTGSVKEMPHRKWKEIDLQPCCWPQLTLPGWCLVSLLFLYGISFTDPVLNYWLNMMRHYEL